MFIFNLCFGGAASKRRVTNYQWTQGRIPQDFIRHNSAVRTPLRKIIIIVIIIIRVIMITTTTTTVNLVSFRRNY
jgi:hypothetical protein